MPIMINETTEETQDQRPRIYPDEIMRHMQKILDGEIKGITMADILLGKIQGDDPRTFGQYLDPKDHETERERVNKCEEEFRQLPACVRLHFNNDVGQVITYLNIHGPKTEKGPDVKRSRAIKPPKKRDRKPRGRTGAHSDA